MGNGIENKSCLEQVFNFKMGCFVEIQVLQG